MHPTYTNLHHNTEPSHHAPIVDRRRKIATKNLVLNLLQNGILKIISAYVTVFLSTFENSVEHNEII